LDLTLSNAIHEWLRKVEPIFPTPFLILHKKRVIFDFQYLLRRDNFVKDLGNAKVYREVPEDILVLRVR